MMMLLLLLWLWFYSSKHGRKEAILGEVIYHEGIASILHDNNCQLLIFIWFCIQSDSMACLIYPEKWISNWVMLDICGLIKRIYCYHQQQHFMSGIVLFTLHPGVDCRFCTWWHATRIIIKLGWGILSENLMEKFLI